MRSSSILGVSCFVLALSSIALNAQNLLTANRLYVPSSGRGLFSPLLCQLSYPADCLCQHVNSQSRLTVALPSFPNFRSALRELLPRGGTFAPFTWARALSLSPISRGRGT
jgi:hypothetical protein